MGEGLIIQTDSFQITHLEFLIRMLVAAGIGFVIGLERELSSHIEEEGEPEIFAGVRTFMVVVLLGFLAALLSFVFTPWLFIAALAGVAGLTIVSYRASAKKGKMGSTTEFAIMLAFLLGGATLLGYVEASLALMVVLVALLSLKVRLHTFIGRITQPELFAFIRFVVIALLIFPFLPNENYGPYNAVNPREVGWIIILISGLGFSGYMLTKFLGAGKGILLAGIFGGLMSSTVVAWVFSRKSREQPAFSGHCAVAILSAASIMAIRVLALVWIFNRHLLPGLLLPMGLLLLASLGPALYFYRKQAQHQAPDAELPLGNPLNLWEALFFGALYTGILLLVNYANDVFGARGILLSGSIAGLADIDAIAISISKMGGGPITALTAHSAILLATLSNTLSKAVIALWFGAADMRRYILTGFGLIFLAGLLGLLALYLV